MRALFHGERAGTFLQVLILSVLVVLGTIGIVLTLQARDDAARAERVQQRMTSAFSSYQKVVQDACIERNRKADRVDEVERADAVLMRRQIAIDRVNPVADPTVRHQRATEWRRKLRADLLFLSVHQPDCNKLAVTKIDRVRFAMR